MSRLNQSKQPVNQLNFILHDRILPSVDKHADTVEFLNKISEQFDTPISGISSRVGRVENHIILNEAVRHLVGHIKNLEIEMEALQDEDVNSQSVTELIHVIEQLEVFKAAIVKKLREIE